MPSPYCWSCIQIISASLITSTRNNWSTKFRIVCPPTQASAAISHRTKARNDLLISYNVYNSSAEVFKDIRTIIKNLKLFVLRITRFLIICSNRLGAVVWFLIELFTRKSRFFTNTCLGIEHSDRATAKRSDERTNYNMFQNRYGNSSRDAAEVKRMHNWRDGRSSYSRSGVFSVLPPSKAMAELWIRKLVQPPGRPHAEVAPHVLAASEVQFLNGACSIIKIQ